FSPHHYSFPPRRIRPEPAMRQRSLLFSSFILHQKKEERRKKKEERRKKKEERRKKKEERRIVALKP
ncbi:TPA: hypothetical protein NNA45_004575, partial [Salmonella enterica]|nr:hypothetical protein [Salmonella enterica]